MQECQKRAELNRVASYQLRAIFVMQGLAEHEAFKVISNLAVSEQVDLHRLDEDFTRAKRLAIQTSDAL